MSDAWDRKFNVASGVVVLLVGAMIAGWALIRPLFLFETEPPPTYIAYFENSGGLREGDAVRIQGRRAGEVTRVEVVMRDGKAVTRVEFTIAPGSGSQWLKQTAIPGDSTISVRTASVLGRPQLMISIGDDDENTIAEGGEWTRTRSANDQDQLTQWHEDLTKAQTQIADFMKFFDDKEAFEKLNSQLAEVADAVRQADMNIAKIAENASEVDGMLAETKKGMDETREQLHGQSDTISDNLKQMTDNNRELGDWLGEIDEKLDGLLGEVQRMQDNSDDLVSVTDQTKLDELGIELRKMAARLRSSADRSVSDPSQAGDMPNWRRTRPYFSGGTPSRGTSIDENPPEAPGEKAGVPKGAKDQKRVK